LVQEINEAGILEVTTSKNVIFKTRAVKNVSIPDTGGCYITIEKSSDEGTLIETIFAPIETFEAKIENSLWQIIDEQKKV
jgi:hypothetical protein